MSEGPTKNIELLRRRVRRRRYERDQAEGLELLRADLRGVTDPGEVAVSPGGFPLDPDAPAGPGPPPVASEAPRTRVGYRDLAPAARRFGRLAAGFDARAFAWVEFRGFDLAGAYRFPFTPPVVRRLLARGVEDLALCAAGSPARLVLSDVRGDPYLGDHFEVASYGVPAAGEGAPPPTARLAFRPWRPGDLPDAEALWGDPAVARFLTAGGAFGPAEVRSQLDEQVTGGDRDGFQYWRVETREGPEFVGAVGIRSRLRSLLPEFGVHLRPAFWGRGLAREAAAAVFAYARDRLDLPGLSAGHHPENVGSARLLAALGFRHAGEETYPPTGLAHPAYRLDFPVGEP